MVPTFSVTNKATCLLKSRRFITEHNLKNLFYTYNSAQRQSLQMFAYEVIVSVNDDHQVLSLWFMTYQKLNSCMIETHHQHTALKSKRNHKCSKRSCDINPIEINRPIFSANNIELMKILQKIWEHMKLWSGLTEPAIYRMITINLRTDHSNVACNGSRQKSLETLAESNSVLLMPEQWWTEHSRQPWVFAESVILHQLAINR